MKFKVCKLLWIYPNSYESTFVDPSILIIILGFIIFLFCKVYKENKKDQEKQKRKAEYDVWREKVLKEYAIKKEKAVKETRSHETRPKDWDLRRDYIKERDGYKCSICGRSTKLHVHHKMPVSESPDHSENNLITLCVYCHAKQPGKGHGERLINGEIAAQCEKYNYEKKKSRKDYICNICEEIINKGDSSYVKKSFQVNNWWTNPNERICERCLLENPSGYPKKRRKKSRSYKFDYDNKTRNVKSQIETNHHTYEKVQGRGQAYPANHRLSANHPASRERESSGTFLTCPNCSKGFKPPKGGNLTGRKFECAHCGIEFELYDSSSGITPLIKSN